MRPTKLAHVLAALACLGCGDDSAGPPPRLDASVNCAIEGDTRWAPCEAPSEGLRQQTCSEGVWVPLEGAACVHTPRCEPGETQTRTCGINGERTMSQECVDGLWHAIDGGCTAVDDAQGHVCVNRAVQSTHGGGFNGRDTVERECREGRFGPPRCVACDECRDDTVQESELSSCPDGYGPPSRTCLDGYWTEYGPCVPVGDCAAGAQHTLACGPNLRGLKTLACTDGRWPAVEDVACEGAGTCVDEAVCHTSCGGLNGRALWTARCVQGAWNDGGACVAMEAGRPSAPGDAPDLCHEPDVCEDRRIETRACGPGSQMSRVCISGHWSTWSPCVATIPCAADAECPGICVDGACAWPSCHDGRADPPEEGTDCGGLCGPCAAPEICNRLDDDGDGSVDETFDTGDLCEVGESACVEAGVVDCADDGGTRCRLPDGAEPTEACNGLDDDCDGRVDEGSNAWCSALPGVRGARCEDGVCALDEEGCRPGWRDIDGLWTNGCEIAVCVDDVGRLGTPCQRPIVGSTCTCIGRGVCVGDAPGLFECALTVDDSAQCPLDERAPTLPSELCNGLDDDCDGATDEDYPGLGAPCGDGACRGIAECGPDGGGICRPSAAPVPTELCNGLDDDCDGAIDEVSGDEFAECAAHPSVARAVCADGACVVLTCVDPRRGDLDNDANNGCEVALECGADGVCERPMYPGVPENTCVCHGIEVCVVDDGIVEPRCSASSDCSLVVGAQRERCDGTDDDCDGFFDEAVEPEACYEGPAGTEGIGQCAPGARACVDGARGACEGQVLPREETCDGTDEDCDGRVDEAPDRDGDAVCDTVDVCPGVPDPDQADSDRDGVGDACDPCPLPPAAIAFDTDADGVPDPPEECIGELGFDSCPRVPNPVQGDRDRDGVGDACDPCPDTPSGPVRDGDPDTDGDGILDLCDNCPDVFNVGQEDADRDGDGDRCDDDHDGDRIANADDVCPFVPDSEQLDADEDGIGDACIHRPDRPAVVCNGREIGPPCNGCPPGTRIPSGWVCVPAGEFWMGSPQDDPSRDADENYLHRVRISRPMLVTETEVTQAQWSRVFPDNPSRWQPCEENAEGSCPVEQVTVGEALALANALSGDAACYAMAGCEGTSGVDFECDGIDRFVGPACAGYRLPTEAEYEYLLRAGTSTTYWSGEDSESVSDGAWLDFNSEERTHPVGRLRANPWGLYDVHGNVNAIIPHWWGPYPNRRQRAVIDPVGPPAGSVFTTRGGSYGSARGARASHRGWALVGQRREGIGMRLVRTVTEPQAVAEVCNGIDDDGDFLVDEGTPGVGEPCNDAGPCDGGSGATACDADGEIICRGRQPRAESCNRTDDDCDGLIDEIVDSDGDGKGRCRGAVGDNCPDVANPNQEDTDGDGLGDACDPTDDDRDNDGLPDAAEDLDGDGWLDPGETDPDAPDTDGDRVLDGEDVCPRTVDPGQADSDRDGVGDACDICPEAHDPQQAVRDGQGLACLLDHDRDGIPSLEDTCPFVPDPGQVDTDGDGIGDACEAARNEVVVCTGDEQHPPCNGCPAGTRIPQGAVCVPAGLATLGQATGDTDPYEMPPPEGPQREVWLTRPLLVDMTEVTRGAWRDALLTDPSRFSECNGGETSQCPVESMTWFDALAFANVRSGGSPTGGQGTCYALADCVGRPGNGLICGSVDFVGLDCAGWRLATEAEWEYLTRAGTTTRFWSGDGRWTQQLWRGDPQPVLDGVGWWGFVSDGRPRPVASGRPSPWGVFDVHGNVAEWTTDAYDGQPWTAELTRDPLVVDGPLRVIRGGAWSTHARITRSAARAARHPGYVSDGLGVRLVRSLPAVEPRCDLFEADRDRDRVCNIDDNCPDVPNRGQSDRDSDGIGDACDHDLDGDGLPDVMEDADGDNIVDPGETDPLDADSDGDGVIDGADLCPAPREDPDDCDDDADEDGVTLLRDNCPFAANPDQADLDGDGRGDACDPFQPPVVCGEDDWDPPCNGCPPGTEVPSGWICVPPGVFPMGEAEVDHEATDRFATRSNTNPGRTVHITRPFLIMKTELTRDQWSAVFPDEQFAYRPCNANLPALEGQCPANELMFHEVVAYANALSGADTCYTLTGCEGDPGTGMLDPDTGMMTCDFEVESVGPDCRGYRLPTEAELSYAMRAGSHTRFWGGPDLADMSRTEWCGNSPGNLPQPVALKPANNWGLHDMAGNVMEWTNDWTGPMPDPRVGSDTAARDPVGPPYGHNHPTPAGYAWWGEWNCRTARREGRSHMRYDELRIVGARLVRTLHDRPVRRETTCGQHDCTLDGADDDCDGIVDEDGAVLGETCESDLPGVCRIGLRTCDDGVPTCTPQYEPAEVDQCNGLDEDCDGEVDEDDGGQGVCTPRACPADGPDYRDADVDGVHDDCDLCPDQPGGDGADRDGDGVGDACDGCPDLDEAMHVDTDRDGIGDACDDDDDGDQQLDEVDPCPGVPDDGADADGNGIGDACEWDLEAPSVECAGDEIGPPCNGCPAGVRVPSNFVCIPAGEFWMGASADDPDADDDETRRRVRISRPFLMSRTEVTMATWEQYMDEQPGLVGGEAMLRGELQPERRPSQRITWFEAATMLNAASGEDACYELSGCASFQDRYPFQCDAEVGFAGPGCSGYRLPTAAEWEYAARAGATTRYPLGDDAAALGRSGWYGDTSDGYIHLVGEKPPNRWGLFDMHGNLWEMTHDIYAEHRFPQGEGEVDVDPTGPDGVSLYREVRGGSWITDAPSARITNRHRYRADLRWDLGFRMVKTVSLDENGIEAEPVDFCLLHFPASIEGTVGEMVTVYGRIFEQGVTDRSAFTDPDDRVRGQLGLIGDLEPDGPHRWTWIDASPNLDFEGFALQDEYLVEFRLPAAGRYRYAFRFSADGGQTHQRCDLDGAGSSPGSGEFTMDETGLMVSAESD